MNIKISKTNLLENLLKVSKAITGKSNVEALKGVYIQVDKGTILILGSDTDLSILAHGTCEVIEPGIILVDAKIFMEIIRKMPNGDISISKSKDNENLIEISAGKCLFNICCMNEKEYPDFPNQKNGTEVTLSKEVLKRMIGQTSFAIAQDESRPILQGILFEIKNSLLKLVALDGYRVALCSKEIDSSLDINAVVDGKSITNISRLIDGAGDVKLYLHQNHIEFRFDNLVIYSRLLEGQFINYEALLPKESKIDVLLDRMQLLEAIERSSLIAKSETSENPTLKLSFKNEGMCDVLIINANSNKGKGREELLVEITSPEKELEIAFNGRYLVDMLKNMDSTRVLMKFNTNLTPCTCEPDGNTDSKYLVLPIRLQK